ncbi:OLC1v1017156C1 [Oldenlandia corymbosa var. corymbosa]|uniref:OLC1v1017156C1 n=1 Tax=Oldenlandia corymbosa var. corymbosa TaxID=529605 RepID=A0AAV1E8T8_OLDCO|nr:OLC1v1017156C1 [Oldenlandia corymbosa var. corymbosa]
MVKAVVGEESRLKLVEDRLSQVEIGLVIGKLSKSLDKGFVYDLIPTPLNDAGEPAASLIETASRDDTKKKGSKAKPQSDSSTLFIDKDWIAEHARQVSRMLLGGMMVIGVYISVNESCFKNSTTLLCQTVKVAADAAPSFDSETDERLLIHISYSPRRWTCRNCSLASSITSGSLRPCDFKLGKVLASLKELRCIYNFSIRLPVHSEKEQRRNFSDVLRQGLSSHTKALKSAKCLIDGKLVIEEDQFVPDGPHEVEFLLPFMQDDEVVGVLVFKGSVCSFAYLNPKEFILQALHDIKEDIIKSLNSRLDILCDEAEGESESVNKDQEASTHTPTSKQVLQLNLQFKRQYSSLSFPRRVFIPWLASAYICDYVLPSETIEVIKDHCVELMSMEAPQVASEILELESEASLVTSTTKSFSDVANSASKSDSSLSVRSAGTGNATSVQSATKSTPSTTFAALFVLFMSILVGLILLFLRS